MKRALLVLSCVLAACDETEAQPTTLDEPIGVFDVSLLYPIPGALAERTSLVGAAEVGAKGTLLPRDVYEQLPRVDLALPNQQSYDMMRVVAVRFDPCFPALREPCQNQIRVVMQPVVFHVSGEMLVASDDAIHLFYALTREQWVTAVRRVSDLGRAAGVGAEVGPLGVHPALSAEGVEGTFADGLRQVLLDNAGEQNLSRVTFMALGGFGDVWTFGGFDVDGGALVPMPIAGISQRDQTFVNLDHEGVSFVDASIAPASTSADDLSLLLDPEAAAAATSDAVGLAYAAALRIESPDHHTPETVDCASCHVAMSARSWAEVSYALSAEGRPDAYRSEDGAIPAGATAYRTNHLRAFGHFGTLPSISQRVVNETAAVVAYVNREIVGR